MRSPPQEWVLDQRSATIPLFGVLRSPVRPRLDQHSIDARSACTRPVGDLVAYAGSVNRSKGMLLLGVWVILSNLVPLLSVRVPNSSLLLTTLGIVAGVLLLVDR